MTDRYTGPPARRGLDGSTTHPSRSSRRDVFIGAAAAERTRRSGSLACCRCPITTRSSRPTASRNYSADPGCRSSAPVRERDPARRALRCGIDPTRPAPDAGEAPEAKSRLLRRARSSPAPTGSRCGDVWHSCSIQHDPAGRLRGRDWASTISPNGSVSWHARAVVAVACVRVR